MQDSESILLKLQERLGPLEAQRVDVAARAKRANLIVVAGLIGGVLGCYLLSYVAIWAVIVGAIATVIALITIHHNISGAPFEKFRQQFKAEFIRHLLENMTDDVRYVPAGDASVLTHYHQSELFSRKLDRSSIEDSIFASIGTTELIASELHTEYESTSTDSDGSRKTDWNTIFKGLFISAHVQKQFQGKTIIHPDVAEKTFGEKVGRFMQSMTSSGMELIQLDDPEFEKEFVVRSTAPSEAHSILTSSMMQRILELRQKFSGDVHLAFHQSRVYVAISTNRDFFEPQLTQSLTERETLRESLEQVQLCLGVIKDLDLKTQHGSRA